MHSDAGHSTSWQRGYPEIQSKCTQAAPVRLKEHLEEHLEEHFTTPMDPTTNKTYKLLDTLLKELDPFFPESFPFWHLGGDEVATTYTPGKYRCHKIHRFTACCFCSIL